ncbi:MAG TPA: Mth938-like domain-containing protein [Burkholderiaceae bacterium]|nr:Mth938-like domain-containing protein [Burkholderiaceae bacterium]
MKFQPDFLAGVNTIARHDGHRVWIGAQFYDGSVVVPWSGAVRPWGPAHFDDLSQAHFDVLLQREPELVIFGSGERLRFPKPELLRTLIERRVGVETMDTAAACRTFNVLANEGRNVVAALLLGPL